MPPQQGYVSFQELATAPTATPAPEPTAGEVTFEALGGPRQALAGVGIETVSDEQWATMTPQQRLQGLLKAAGYGLSGMLGMGEAGRDAVEHPKTTLATAAVGAGLSRAQSYAPKLAERAGAKFEAVASKANKLPVSVEKAADAALDIKDLAASGGSMPKAARDLLRRVGDIKQGDLTYEEARKFYSNITRLSADESRRLTPVIRRELGRLRASLGEAIEGTAESVGQGATYRSAMKEYARAAKLKAATDAVKTFAKKWAIPAIGGGAAANYAANQFSK